MKVLLQCNYFWCTAYMFTDIPVTILWFQKGVTVNLNIMMSHEPKQVCRSGSQKNCKACILGCLTEKDTNYSIFTQATLHPFRPVKQINSYYVYIFSFTVKEQNKTKQSDSKRSQFSITHKLCPKANKYIY